MLKESMITQTETKKNADWKLGRAHLTKIEQVGGIGEWVANSKPDAIEKAFCKHPKCLCCMDERVVCQKKDGVYSAGSGILVKDDPEKREAFIAELQTAGVTETTTHDGCGAVALYAEKKGITVEEAKKEAVEWAKYLADRLKGKYKGELRVAIPYHNAQSAYYDLTGTFNPQNASKIFPEGFVISRKYMKPEDAVLQIQVGVSIATGKNGFGDRFSEETPFSVVIVASSAEELATAKAELSAVASHSVNISGFVKPQKP